MIRSMTGFGRASHKYPGGKIAVELKTVNSRFYELSGRLPNSILFLEDKIRGYINTKIRRGRASLSLATEGNGAAGKPLAINKKLAKKYYETLKGLQRDLGIREGISLGELALLPEVITCQPVDVAAENRVWPHIKIALDAALARLVKAREQEGRQLHKDLALRAQKIERLILRIAGQAPQTTVNYRKNLNDRIAQISHSVKLDSGRLETEVAMFAKNCDITEEIIRMRSHIKNFKALLSGRQEVGRQLDFVAQELFREINTIGAKAQDIKISKWAIQIKEEIEKIREQAQNVE